MRAERQQVASPGSELVEIDSWVVQFAQLFRDALSIDPDRHVDLQQEGWDRVQRALDQSLVSDGAPALFEKGIDKFREVIALGHINWGHAHSALARKHLEDASRRGVRPSSTPSDPSLIKASAELDKAAKRMQEAMEIKPDFYDGAVGAGQVCFERAKRVGVEGGTEAAEGRWPRSRTLLCPPPSPVFSRGIPLTPLLLLVSPHPRLAAGLLLTNPATTPETEDGATAKETEEAAYRAGLAAADGAMVTQAAPLFAEAVAWHDRGAAAAAGAAAAGEGGEGGGEAALSEAEKERRAADAAQLRHQSGVLAGNVLYELSQARERGGRVVSSLRGRRCRPFPPLPSPPPSSPRPLFPPTSSVPRAGRATGGPPSTRPPSASRRPSAAPRTSCRP